MLKTDSIESVSLNAIDKQQQEESTNKTNSAANKFKQIALIKFDDANNQQMLPNYLSNISDQVKVGFYSCDRFTQTEQSDIVPIGEATHNLIYLCKEIDVVKYDLNFAKNSYQNRFDLELQNKSIEIYAMINQKFNEMKKQHEENIDRIRKAYKTQLANAIVKITNLAEEKYSSKMPENSNIDKNDFKTQALMQRIKELQRLVGEKEIDMKIAKEKSEEVIERLIPNQAKSASNGRLTAASTSSNIIFNNDNDINNAESSTTANNEDNEAIVKALTEERDNAYQEINSINRKLTRMEEALTLKEDETERLSNEIARLELQLDNEKTQAELVTREYQDFKTKTEIEKKNLKKEFDKQKKELEIKMQEKLKETREQILNAAKEEMRQKELEQEKQRHQLEEKQRQNEKKLLEQQKKAEEALKKSLEQQKQQQEKLLEKAKLEKEREIERLHREKEKEKEKEKESKKDLETSQSVSGGGNIGKESQDTGEITDHPPPPPPPPPKVSRKEDLDLIHNLKLKEQFYKVEVARLHKEINRNNETWEKRFDILKHSLHAIKDEMYLRQNLQKQSVQLAYASIAYTMDEAPQQQQQHTQSHTSQSIRTDINPVEMKISKPVLPSIGKNAPDRQASSYTNSMPSRLSIQLENDEAQVIDDDEMKKFKDEFFADVDYIIAK